MGNINVPLFKEVNRERDNFHVGVLKCRYRISVNGSRIKSLVKGNGRPLPDASGYMSYSKKKRRSLPVDAG